MLVHCCYPLCTCCCPPNKLCCLRSEQSLTAPNPSGTNKTWLLRPYDMVSQAAASAFCRQRGGELLTITGANDTALLRSALQQYNWSDPAKAWNLTLWIGLVANANAAGTSDKRVWSFLSTGKTPLGAQDNWNAGGPSDGLYCSYMDAGDGKWYSSNCAAPNRGFMCQLGACVRVLVVTGVVLCCVVLAHGGWGQGSSVCH